MLHCPFCNAELPGDQPHTRGGRCPACGSIISWAEPPVAAPPPAPPASVPPPARGEDEPPASIRDIVRTLVTRSAGGETSPPVSPPARRPPDALAALNQTQAIPQESIEKMWRGTLTASARPSMTLKAASVAPDPAVDDLLIRPHRIRFPDEANVRGAEYELLEAIGEGGVGVVYAARQASIDRTVALKMLKQEFAHQSDHRQKFLSEAVVTGELDHPNIVPIYDLGTSDLGALFYSMKRVRGTPWSQVIRDKPLAENLRILLSVSDAIAFAHDRGVIHRDLKPENVMLGDYGEVLVMDWGIALSTSVFLKGGRISQTTSMGGTPAYMAPEMATGPLTAIGPASDVYLLGAILYEIITGQPPHTGKDVMGCLYAAARNEIQPTDKQGELLDIALRAMATRPADRYANVQEFQAAIRAYQSHSESVVLSARADEELAEARRSRDYQDFSRALFAYQEASSLWSENQRARAGEIEVRLEYARCALEKGDFDLGLSLLDERDVRQAPLKRQLAAAQHERDARKARLKSLRNVALGLAATIFIVVTGGLIVIGRTNRDLREAKTKLEDNAVTLRQNADVLQQNADKLAAQKKDLELSQVRLQARGKQLEQARDQALQEAENARQAQQRALAASYLSQIGVGAERVANNSFVDAQDLLRYYVDQTSYFRNWEWGHLTYLCGLARAQQPLAGRIECLAGNSDGTLLAAGGNTGQVFLRQIDWAAGTITDLATLDAGGSLVALALSADGRRLATVTEARPAEVQLWDRTTQPSAFEKGRILAGHKAKVVGLAFSADGQQLATGSLDESARLWNVATGGQLEAYYGHFGPVWAVAHTTVGGQGLLATAGDDGTVRIWAVGQTKTPRCVYRGHLGAVYAVDFSPAGDLVASAGLDKTVQVWDPAQVQPFSYRDVESRIRTRGITPETETSQLPRVLPVPDHWQLVGHEAEIHAVRFTADGRHVVSAGNDNTLRWWDFRRLADIDSVRTLRGHGGWVRGCIPDRSGRYLASAGHDGQLKLWDVETYEEVGVLRSHTDAVLWAAFSPDGQRIVTAGRDRQALLWRTGERQPMLALSDEPLSPATAVPVVQLREGHEFLVTALAQFPLGDRRLVTSAGDNTVRIWDQVQGGQIRRLDGTGTLSVVALSEGGHWILTGSERQDALLWSADDPLAPPLRLGGHAAEVSAAAIAPGDGPFETLRLATADVAGGLRLWRYDPGRREFVSSELRGHEPGYAIVALRFTPDGRRLLSASQDHTVSTWDCETGRRLPDALLRHPAAVRSLDLSTDGQRALTLCAISRDTYRVFHWDLTRAAAETCDFQQSGQTLASAAFSFDQHAALLVSTGSDTSRLWRWTFGSTGVAPLWPRHEIRGLVWTAVPTRDGRHILAAGGSQARLLDAATGRQERTFSPHSAVTSANFSPQGDLVATSSVDGDVKLWMTNPEDPAYGRVVVKISGAHAVGSAHYAVNFAAFSPRADDAGLLLATAGDDNTARLFRIAGQQATQVRVLAGHRQRVRAVGFSPDGRWLVTASDDGEARLWPADAPAESTEPAARLSHPAAVLFAAFSPDGSRIITGCDDNNARVWDVSDPSAPRLAITLEGHTAGVTSAAVSPDGRRAVTGSQDGMAKLWDLETVATDGGGQSREVLSLKRHTAEVTSVHFSPQGRYILTSSTDWRAILWPSVDISPSLKLSRPTSVVKVEPGRVQRVDPQAELRDPDSQTLAAGRLEVAVVDAALAGAVRLEIVPAGGLEIEDDSVILTQPDGQRVTIGTLERSEPSRLRLQLAEGCPVAAAQVLLRAVGWSSTVGVAGELEIAFELVTGSTRSGATIRIVPAQQELDLASR